MELLSSFYQYLLRFVLLSKLEINNESSILLQQQIDSAVNNSNNDFLCLDKFLRTLTMWFSIFGQQYNDVTVCNLGNNFNSYVSLFSDARKWYYFSRLMQGWLFVHDATFWTEPRVEAFLTSVPLVNTFNPFSSTLPNFSTQYLT